MLSSGDRLGKLIKFLFIVLILAIIAVAVTPLNLYYDHIEKQMRPTSLSGISGSAVKGSAENLSYLSAPMGQAEWLLYPNSLNSLGGKVRVYRQNYDLTFEIDRLKQDQQSFKKVTGFLDWDSIKPFLQIRYGQLDGYARVDLNRVVFSQNEGVKSMEGEITLQDFKLQNSSMDLGVVTLALSTQKEGMVVGNFSSNSKALNVSGTLYIQPRRWQLKLDLIPKAGYYEMDALLNGVGDPRRGGGRQLNLAGFY